MIQLLDELDIIISVDENLSLLQEFVVNAAAKGKFGIADKTVRDNFKAEVLDPMNWEIVKIEEISEFTNGYAFKSSDYRGDGIGIIRMSDLKYGEISTQHLKYVSKSFLSELSSALQVKPNDLVIGMSGSIGRPCFNRTEKTFLLNQRVGKLTPNLGLVTPEYLAISLASLEQHFLQISMGSAIKNLSTAQIKQAKVLLPPLAIQKVIVTHYEKFSSLTKSLKASLSFDKNAALKFRNSSIDAISTAQTPEELQNSWERIQGNWEVITESSESIADLRGLILTFAASGLLVKQNLSERPPRFESVASTKEIPKNWIWCELDAIANYGGNGSVSPKSIPNDGWILDLEDIEKSTSRLLTRSYGVDRKTTSNKSSFNSGDVLYGKLRPYLDKVLVADMPGFCTTEIVPIRPKDGLDPNWLRICLKRPEFIKKVTELSYGTKMPRLGTNDAKTSVHPIPPLEEQRRIVERVDQLFQVCDQLEQDLILAKNIGDKFARSVVSA
jgi:restriction endonuclease S subunit